MLVHLFKSVIERFGAHVLFFLYEHFHLYGMIGRSNPDYFFGGYVINITADSSNLFQDMIENVLEIKDTHVREVMTPLVDVVAIDGSAKLIDFQKLWETHQYSRFGELLNYFTEFLAY